MERNTLKESEMVDLLRRQCEEAGNTSRVARDAGVSPQYLWAVLNNKLYVSKRLAEFLGYKLIKKREFEKITL